MADLSFSADTAGVYPWRTDLQCGRADGDQDQRTVVREAVGVVGAITPELSPSDQPGQDRSGTGAGNTVVLKPAPDTPWCAAVLGELAAAHGPPPGVLNIVTSDDHAVGRADP